MKDMNAAYAFCSGNLHTSTNSLGPNSLISVVSGTSKHTKTADDC